MTPRLSDLREPPIVGQHYMVPVVFAGDWCGMSRDLPVIGPAHTDKKHFDFDWRHYHVDLRFLSRVERRHAVDYYGCPVRAVGAMPITNRFVGGISSGLPRLARRRCVSADAEYAHEDKEPVQMLRRDYPSPAEPIRLRDGRVLCPHRRVDLSQFPADVNGIVTCPLHGLRVRCGAQADA